MNRRLLATLLITALAGLTLIQFRLLMAGIRLEKQRFDQQVKTALRTVGRYFEEARPATDSLIVFFGKMSDPPDSAVARSMDSLLQAELEKQGLSLRFQYAVTDKFDENVFLASPDFDPAKFRFSRYVLPPGQRMVSLCRCERVLHLDVEDLLAYLLWELDYLVLPSALCLLVILACMVLLINILRNEQRLNAIKNDFINNLTHELNTPAFSIGLSAKMAKETLAKGDPGKAIHFIELIGKENDKLKSHIGKVLELASLESPRYTLQKAPTDLHPLIRETAAEFLPAVEARGGRLTLQLDASQSEVKTDVPHFKNILRNLLENALKYTSEVPVIEIRTVNERKQLIIRVKDNGIGISLQHQRQVFDKFFRVPTGDLHPVKGFGLGLHYVRQIIVAHGGKISVESSGVGQGTVFTIAMPVS
jgi:two-component system phosphate regulon sensor histidine kinase PhoR